MSKKKPLSKELQEECAAAHQIFLEKKNALKLSQKKIADAAGISAPAVNHYFKGVNPLNVQFAAVLARLLEVSVSDFSPRLAAEIEQISEAIRMEHDGKESNVIAADFSSKGRLKDGELSIPQYNVRGALGHGQVPADYTEIIRHVTVHESLLSGRGISFTKPESLAIITGFGQSMEGTINDGDPLIVDRGINQFIGDGIYVLTWDNLLYIKRLQKHSPDQFDMISDNKLHKDQVIDIADVTIHARVLLVWNAKKL